MPWTQYLDWAGARGLPVRGGVLRRGEHEPAREARADRDRRATRFVVLGEIGTKDPRVPVTARAWALAAAADLEAGATWVVTEGRESGTVGLFDPDGEVRADVVGGGGRRDRCRRRSVFEAPRKDQQAWLIRHFGPDVNLGNVAPGEALGLEALRLGLRADTFDAAERAGRARR